MVNLRLFANLRETAGKNSAVFSGNTVDEVISAATKAYGADFERGLETAKIWVNGDPAERSTEVAAGDEIALIPPVSGGENIAVRKPDTTGGALVIAVLASLFVSNYVSKELFSLVAVGVTIAWLWDVRDTLILRGAKIEIIPPMVAAAAAANGAWGWGGEGFATGLAGGLIFQLIWVVLDPRSRSIDNVAQTTGLGFAAGFSAGSLILVRLQGEQEITIFLVLASIAALATWALRHLAPAYTILDPNVVGLLTTLAASVLAAFATDILEFPVMILGAIAIGSGSIGGHALGSLARSGSMVHTRQAPGLLTIFDGPILASAAFWVVILVFG